MWGQQPPAFLLGQFLCYLLYRSSNLVFFKSLLCDVYRTVMFCFSRWARVSYVKYDSLYYVTLFWL